VGTGNTSPSAAVDPKGYRPAPRESRRGIGICLSGGGYRATLFHMGALRRLNELGVLAHADLRTISSVSGGSITSAFLALAFQWPLRSIVSPQDWKARFSGPLRDFTRRNIRDGAFFKSILPGRTAVGGLAERYDTALRQLAGTPGPVRLGSVPSSPGFTFCATDLAFGVNWESTAREIGDYQAGYVPTPDSWTVGLAVAASSCFPPVFQPLEVPFQLGEWERGKAKSTNEPKWRAAMQNLRLTDGGDYDNMGTEPVWKDHSFVLVSDAGGLFDFQADKDLLWRIQRYQAVQELQTRALRKRWLIASFEQGVMDGSYWSTGSARCRYDEHDLSGYSKDLAQDVIAEIRTDLDAFSDAEAAVLENHGYLLADKAVLTHCPEVARTPSAPLQPPFEEWLPPKRPESEIRRALADSHKRKIPFGRR
jgi:NTE family protein